MKKTIYLAIFSIFMLNFMMVSIKAQPAWKEDMKYEKEKMKKQQEYEREKIKAEREYEKEFNRNEGKDEGRNDNESNIKPNSNMTPLEKWRQMPKAKRQELYSQLPNDMKAQLDSWMSMTLADRKSAWRNLSEAEKKKWRKAFARF